MITSKDIEFNEKNHRYKIKDKKPVQHIPSVTTIAGLLNKPYLVEWAAREAAIATADALTSQSQFTEQTVQASIATGRSKPRELRETGAGIGSAVHQQVKKLLVPSYQPEHDRLAELDDNARMDASMALDAFNEWHQQVINDDAHVVYCERIVVHPTGLYVGTFDLLLRYPDGALRIVDFKTSNQSESNPLAIYPEYFFQISAYRRALQESPEYDDTLGYWDDAQLVALGKNGQLGVTTLSGAECDEYADAFMHMARVHGVYNKAKRDINKLNKAENERRAGQEEV